MKWFFLALLLSFAVGGEILILRGASDAISADRVGGGVALALFCLALLAYWLASYFLEGARQDRSADFAHSMLLLSIGAYCLFMGSNILMTDSCIYPLPRGGTQGIDHDLAKFTSYLQERGWCAALGWFFLLVGAGFSWPMLKLLHRTFGDKGTPTP